MHKHFETEGLRVNFAPYESITKHVQATVSELVCPYLCTSLVSLQLSLSGPIRQNLDFWELQCGADQPGAEAQSDQWRYPRLPHENNQKPYWSQWHDQCSHKRCGRPVQILFLAGKRDCHGQCRHWGFWSNETRAVQIVSALWSCKFFSMNFYPLVSWKILSDWVLRLFLRSGQTLQSSTTLRVPPLINKSLTSKCTCVILEHSSSKLQWFNVWMKFWFVNCFRRDGTTDVTRTIHLGTPTDFERECYTRVFKGCYALRSCIFPAKIKVCYWLTAFKNI